MSDVDSQLRIDPSSQALLDYWRKIRGDNLVPLRSSLRPADITKLLPSLILLEYREPDQLVYRSATAAEIKASEQDKAIKGLEMVYLDIGAGLPVKEAGKSGVAG